MTDTDLRVRQREYIRQHNAAVRARTVSAGNRAAWPAFFALNPDGEALCSEVQRLDPTKPWPQG